MFSTNETEMYKIKSGTVRRLETSFGLQDVGELQFVYYGLMSKLVEFISKHEEESNLYLMDKMDEIASVLDWQSSAIALSRFPSLSRKQRSTKNKQRVNSIWFSNGKWPSQGHQAWPTKQISANNTANCFSYPCSHLCSGRHLSTYTLRVSYYSTHLSVWSVTSTICSRSL